MPSGVAPGSKVKQRVEPLGEDRGLGRLPAAVHALERDEPTPFGHPASPGLWFDAFGAALVRAGAFLAAEAFFAGALFFAAAFFGAAFFAAAFFPGAFFFAPAFFAPTFFAAGGGPGGAALGEQLGGTLRGQLLDRVATAE